MHWSLAVMAFVIGSTLMSTVFPTFAPGYGEMVVLAVAGLAVAGFFASIVAHELGHSLVALRRGVPVRQITLFALGGVAALEKEPRAAKDALHIAIAGPAVSVVVGIGSLLGAALLGVVGAPSIIAVALAWLGLVNLSLALFNMLPAFPLDGGRVWQAVQWRRLGDRDRATISAAKTGGVIGWVLVAYGLWQFMAGNPGLWTAMIGVFVIMAGKAEASVARRRIAEAAQAARWRATQLKMAPYGPSTPYGPVIETSGREHSSPPS